MANKLDAAIPRKDMTINENDTTPAANSRFPASAGSEFSFLFLVCEIREAVGDPEGRLMQDELVGHCKTMRMIGDMMARMLETTPNAPAEGWPDDQEIMETVASWRKLFQNL